jgi:hypothetical protein
MSLFIRKINRNKWLQVDEAPDDVSADAITGCMRTLHNTLSVWEVQDENEIDEAVLAIVSAGDRLESVDVVQIDRECLVENKIDCIRTKGDTLVEELKDTHIDLSNLAYKELGIIACHIVDKFKEKKVKRYTEGQIKAILRDAIQQERLETENLNESIRKKL